MSTPSNDPSTLDEQLRAALERVLAERAQRSELELRARPSAWQLAALKAGVER